MEASSRHLVFHGAIVLLFGLLMGAPYGKAINRKAADHIVHSWRVAHASLPIGALVMFAIGALLPFTPASVTIKWLIAASLIVSSYAFCVSLPLAAITGHRGISSAGPLAARFVYTGNIVGAVASVIGAVGFVYATYLAL